MLIDDSIVRGTTSARIVKLLRDAGSKEIHFRISSRRSSHPVTTAPYIDSEEHLIASKQHTGELRGLSAPTVSAFYLEELNALCKKAAFAARVLRRIIPTAVPKSAVKLGFEPDCGNE